MEINGIKGGGKNIAKRIRKGGGESVREIERKTGSDKSMKGEKEKEKMPF